MVLNSTLSEGGLLVISSLLVAMRFDFICYDARPCLEIFLKGM